ncbi:MAG: hypothetical protein PHR83_18535 [Paludibacter sp.]|nr:hypothetical protein [Paludibacter sp.]
MKKEDLLFKIVQSTNEEECLLVGNATVKNIIRDALNSKEGIAKKYIPSGLGHGMGVVEAILLLFASIQAIESFINIISKFKKKKTSKEVIEITITETLIERKIPEAQIEKIKTEIIRWLEDEMD